ncbi:MAG: hypothetical protein KDD60_07460, partial [Bdellovibrionales bacterium]|nr:hypothetical protein [Bdellovibrionales bacterium]
LPGGATTWPLDTLANGEPVVVVRKSDRPYIRLDKGTYEIRGDFQWSSQPQFIPVPQDVALVQLGTAGNEARAVKVNERGEVWLLEKVHSEPTEQDSLQISVFRRLIDGLPFTVITQLQVEIAGRARDIAIGNPLLLDSTLVDIQSQLPYELRDNNEISLRGKPGRFTVTLTSYLAKTPTSLSPIGSQLPEWPEDEIWVWQENSTLQRVAIEGANQIDPNRTELPDDWRVFPTFLMEKGASLALNTLQRGEGEPQENMLKLHRKFWLDLNGGGYSVEDSFSGTMNREWRLNALPGLAVGRALVNEEPQVITSNEASIGGAGIELRRSAVNVKANSHIEQSARDFSPVTLNAVGWETDVHSLSLDLALPPGWTLLGAVGPDVVVNSWIAQWSLIELLVIAIFTLIVAKLFGVLLGVLFLILYVITHGEQGAPLFLWGHLVFSAILVRFLPEGALHKYARYYFYCTCFFFSVGVFFFVMYQVLYGMYPQLATPLYSAYSSQYQIGYFDSRISMHVNTIFLLFEGAIGGILMLASGAAFIVLLFMRRIRISLLFLVLAISLFFTRSLVSSFFGVSRSFSRAPMESLEYERNMADSVAEMAPMSVTAGARNDKRIVQSKMKIKKYDPNAIVQTGPGTPAWNWNAWRLTWNGTVSDKSVFELYVLSPWMNFGMALLRALLFILFVFLFYRRKLPELLSGVARGAGVTAILFSISIVVFGNASQLQAQEFPPDSLLNELETRMLAEECRDGCLGTEKIQFHVTSETVSVTAFVASIGANSWALPGPLDQLLPSRVLLDGEQTAVLRRDEKGVLWVRIPGGSHTVTFEADVSKRNSLAIRCNSSPGVVDVVAPEWSIEGVSSSGA